jgi:hypothetical protein
MPFDYTTQPEFAGPMAEPRARGGELPESAGPALDYQELARNPHARATVTIGDGHKAYLLDPETRMRERREAILSYDAARDGLRALVEGAARASGADYRIAARTADAILAQVPGLPAEPAPAESEPATVPAEPGVTTTEPAPEPASSAEPEPAPAAVRPRKAKES